MQWAIVIAAFLASEVEFVEAFTLVLVAGITTNWRSAILGALGAAAVLAVIVATLGVALVTYVPIEVLRFVVGFLLLLFGLKWLKNAIQRYAGLKLIHDEQAAYEANLAEARARGEPAKTGLDTFGVLLSFKSVLLEGLEVAFIVISFGGSGAGGIGNAALGALGAGVLVIAVGALVQAPLKRIPENSLKFVVGIMLTSFGLFWGGEGAHARWPGSDAALLVIAPLVALFAHNWHLAVLFVLILAVFYLVVSGLLITGIRLRLPRLVKARATLPATTLVPEKGVQQ
jgi:uncharacterized membrane protein